MKPLYIMYVYIYICIYIYVYWFHLNLWFICMHPNINQHVYIIHIPIFHGQNDPPLSPQGVPSRIDCGHVVDRPGAYGKTPCDRCWRMWWCWWWIKPPNPMPGVSADVRCRYLPGYVRNHDGKNDIFFKRENSL